MLNVGRLNEGVVLDHIEAGKSMSIYKYLKLDKMDLKYLRELEPSTFEDLIAMNALYRPGPMDYIPDFIDRKQCTAPIWKST